MYELMVTLNAQIDTMTGPEALALLNEIADRLSDEIEAINREHRQ